MRAPPVVGFSDKGAPTSRSLSRLPACLIAVPSRRRMYLSLLAAAVVTVATAVASASETLASLAASTPRTMRTVAWAVRAGLSYKRFQVRRALRKAFSPARCLSVDGQARTNLQAATASHSAGCARSDLCTRACVRRCRCGARLL